MFTHEIVVSESKMLEIINSFSSQSTITCSRKIEVGDQVNFTCYFTSLETDVTLTRSVLVTSSHVLHVLGSSGFILDIFYYHL